MSKLTFLLGAAAGYVLGARAGTQRYEEIKAGASQIWGSQPVQRQVASAKHTTKTKVAPAALDAVSGAAATAGEKLREGAGRITPDSRRDVESSATNGETPQRTTKVSADPDVSTAGDPISDWAEEGGSTTPMRVD